MAKRKIMIEVDEDIAFIIENWEECHGETVNELIRSAFTDAFKDWGENDSIEDIISYIKETKSKNHVKIGGELKSGKY